MLYKNMIIHPGETLKEVLDGRKMTADELAKKADASPEVIKDVIAGRSGISKELAGKLEDTLGIEASFWLNLQKKYESEYAEYACSLAGRLERHAGHHVVIVKYGSWDDPADIALECEDCNEVILDAELYDIIGKEEK